MIPIQNAVATRHTPIVTWSLIAINCLIFLVQISLSPAALEQLLSNFALIPARYFGHGSVGVDGVDDLLPFVTNMFLHGGWIHLILNMWTLWLFGPAVEDRMGPGPYLVFYLLAGVFASLAHAVFNLSSVVPALGASGAISGVLGCYVRLFPAARLVVMIPILFLPFFFEMPAAVFVGLWIFVQILQGVVEMLAPSSGGGIAWWAHIGGFVAGLLLAPALRQPGRLYRPYYADEGILGFDPQGR